MASFQELIYKNGKIIGLNMNSNIASSLHDVGVMTTNLQNLQTEVDDVKKDVLDKNASLTQQLTDLTNHFETEHSDVVSVVKNINTSLTCPDFAMSDPPTADELSAINALSDGSFYTINGGNAVLVYRGKLV